MKAEIVIRGFSNCIEKCIICNYMFGFNKSYKQLCNLKAT